jgi:hypothetical protein
MRKLFVPAVALMLWALVQPAMAQPAGLDLNKDCQTIRTCNFAKGGAYRGCLSSYSCRVCTFVAARCRVDGGNGGQRTCQQLRCSWG